jgi:hypothetical protein
MYRGAHTTSRDVKESSLLPHFISNSMEHRRWQLFRKPRNAQSFMVPEASLQRLEKEKTRKTGA